MLFKRPTMHRSTPQQRNIQPPTVNCANIEKPCLALTLKPLPPLKHLQIWPLQSWNHQFDSHTETLPNFENSEEENTALVNQKDLGQIPGGPGIAVGIGLTSSMDSHSQEVRIG